MANGIADFQCSTEEDLSFELTFSGLDLSGKTLKVTVRERISGASKAVLTIGSGLTLTGTAILRAVFAKASMTSWTKGEYTADLVDESGGRFVRLVPVRFTYDDPGKLVQGVAGSAFQVTQAGSKAVVTAVAGATGPVGPATTLTIGTVTDIASGNPPTVTLAGPAGAQVLSLGVVRGAPGAGAPNSPDIVAMVQQDRLERALAAAGIPDEPSLIADFLRGVHYPSKVAVAASIATLLAAAGGASAFTRSTTATYWDSDGLLKTAAANVPRIEYDPATRVCRGLLIENQSRTNLLTYSNALDDASYGKGAVTITADALTAPDGTVSADKIVENNTTNVHYIVKSGTVVSGSTYTTSLLMKAGERNWIRLQFDDGSATTYAAATFNLANGAVSNIAGTGATAFATDCGNGWWLLEITGTTTATTGRLVVYMGDNTGNFTYAGDGTSGVYAWSCQLELGARASSRILTAASTVTRQLDVLRLDLTPWLQATSPVTLSAEFMLNESRGAATVSYPVILQSAAAGNTIALREGAVIVGLDAIMQSGGVNRVDTGSAALAIHTPIRAGFSVGPASYAFAKDNAAVDSGSSALTMPVGLDRLFLGASGFMGHIRRLVIWPQALSSGKTLTVSNQAAWS